jgi:membrane protease YdiL (CAAX protease family)
LIGLSIFAEGSIGFFLFDDDSALELAIAMVMAGALILALYLVGIRRRGLRWSSFGFISPTRGWLILNVVLAILLAGVMGFLEWVLNIPVTEIAVEHLGTDKMTPPKIVVFGVLTILIAPLIEELFFRGLTYSWIRGRWGVKVGIVTTSLLFGVSHFQHVFWMGSAAIVGVFLAVVYEYSGSLWNCVIFHSVFN